MATLETWVEGAVFSLLFVIIFGVAVIAPMNEQHGGNNTVSGLETDTMEDNLYDMSENLNTKIAGGDVSFVDAIGVTLSTSWNLVTIVTSFIAFYVGGAWINTIVTDYLMLPYQTALILRALYLIAISFLVMRLLFQRRT